MKVIGVLDEFSANCLDAEIVILGSFTDMEIGWLETAGQIPLETVYEYDPEFEIKIEVEVSPFDHNILVVWFEVRLIPEPRQIV